MNKAWTKHEKKQVKKIIVERLSLPQLVKEWRYKMNELKIFENAEFGQVRTIIINNEPMFCLGDLCKALELTAKEVKRRLSDEVVSKHLIEDSLGRTQNTLFVSEDGLYDVILESRKESAKRFRKWVTSEVLPSIRKTGSYHLPSTYKEALIQLVAQVEENERLQLENNELKPKAEFSAISEAVAILIRQL